jgi:hypothetical protein
MTGAGIDALLVSQPENRRYLSGFTGSTAILLVAQETAYIATDSRYWEQAEMECPGYELAQVRGQVGPVVKELVARRRAASWFRSAMATYAGKTEERCFDVEWSRPDLVITLALKDREIAAGRGVLADARTPMRWQDEAGGRARSPDDREHSAHAEGFRSRRRRVAERAPHAQRRRATVPGSQSSFSGRKG